MRSLSPALKRRRRLFSLASMVAGSVGVLALVLAMNARDWQPPEAVAQRETAFDIAAPKAKPKPKRRRAAKKPKPKRAKAPPPAPIHGANLSGLSFGLASLEAGDLSAAADRLLGNTENQVMTADAVDAPPTALSRPAAPYPAKARARGITGFVTLSFLVDQGGAVQDVKIVEAEPMGVFDHTAMQTIRGWQFKPGFYQGEPVSVRVKQTVRFDLSS